MSRRIQTTETAALRYTIAASGDSITHNYTLHMLPEELWPERLAVGLRALGCHVKARNFGRSGDRTAQMLARVDEMTLYDVPDVAVIFGGINDTGTNSVSGITRSGSTATVTTAGNHGLVTGMALTFSGAGQTEYNVTATITVVTATTFTFTVSGTPATPATGTITYAFAGTTQSNIEAIITALVTAGVSRVIVANTPFYNFSSGDASVRDTVATPFTANVAVRAAQVAAVAAAVAAHPSAGIVYCDVYTYFENLLGGPAYRGVSYVAGDFLWHFADANLHLNAAGEQIVADAILATIQAQSGWVAALSA